MNTENCVLFKGKRDGLIILLNEEVDFITLKDQLQKKIVDASKFFNGAKMSISFQGRNLDEDEQNELIDIIKEKSNLNISFIHDSEDEVNDNEDSDHNGSDIGFQETFSKFYKGTIRSGQCIDFSGSVIIVGDVNPGGVVVAEGNIIVLGTLKGMVHAGCKGNTKAFIAALSMAPMQLRIGNIIGRSPDESFRVQQKNVAQIAYVYEERVCIEPIDSKVLEFL